MLKYTLLTCTLFSCFAAADTFSHSDTYGQSGYFGVGANFASTEDKVNDDSLTGLGFNLSAGYFFLPYLGVDMSYGLTPDLFVDEEFEHTDLQLMTRYPLSDYAELYLGVGGSYQLNDIIQDDDQSIGVMGSAGVRYHMMPELALDVGYKFYHDPGGWDSSIAMLNVGLKYYFGATHSVSSTSSVSENPVEASRAQKAIEVSQTCENARAVGQYIVKPGDWLTKIALSHDMTFEEIFSLNSKLTNRDLIYPNQKVLIYQVQESCQ